MANIVVTGGAGFIGSNLVDTLLDSGHNVKIIDNLSTGFQNYINKKATFIKADIRDYPAMVEATKRADLLFHLAALARIQRSVAQPRETNEVNIQGTVNTLEAARLNKVGRVIFTSSSSVYGNQTEFPLIESMEPKPLSPYALQKLTGEWYCRLYNTLYGLQTISLRLFSVYGYRQNENEEHATVIAKYLGLVRRDEPLPINGDGRQKRDFTHVQDVVEACRAIAESTLKGRGQVYNVCSGKPHSIEELAGLMGGKKRFLSRKKGEIATLIGDSSLLYQAVGWRPKHNLRDYLKQK